MPEDISPWAYRVPLAVRLKAAWSVSKLPVSLSCASILLANAVGLAYELEAAWTSISASSAASLSLVLIYMVGWSYRRGEACYEVLGVSFFFEDLAYWIPPQRMLDFLDEHVCAPLAPHLDEDPADLLAGASVRICTAEQEARTASGPSTADIDPPLAMQGPEAQDPAALGLEMKLHVLRQLFPYQTRGDNVAWMKNRGI